jgi:hypothetical protein
MHSAEQEGHEASPNATGREQETTLDMPLAERALQLLPAVKEAFEAYETEIGARRTLNGWASLTSGRTERFVRCFAPMAHDLVNFLRGPQEQSEDPELVIMNLIENAVMGSDLLPTSPWMPAELFADQHFRSGMLKMINAQVSGDCEPMNIVLPKPSALAAPPTGLRTGASPKDAENYRR